MSRRSLACLLVLASFGFVLAAEEPGDLGSIDFPNSGPPAAQEPFLRGVLFLHSFEYEDARDAFLEAQTIAPRFALAYWGEAMTHNHPLWAQQDQEAALAALAKLAPTPDQRSQLAPTEREKDYLDAVEILYGSGSKQERDLAYERAMASLHERYPDDLEAAAFHALSILGSVRERDFRTYMRAGAVAEEVFARNPQHPGAVHYMIHSYDDPVHAPLGLRPARVYARIAPAASHAQHMISHIYTALGEWEQVVDANEIAVAVSERRLERKGRHLHHRSHHALFWLEYGLLQQGRYEEALQKVQTMRGDADASGETMARWHDAQMRAAWLVARPRSSDVAPGDLTNVTIDAVAADALAMTLGALAAGHRETAKASRTSLEEELSGVRISSEDEGRNAYDGAASEDHVDVARIMAMEVDALLQWSDGKRDAAIDIMKRAAARESERPLEYGPPSIVKPTHELLGEMLLSAGKPEEARAAFSIALERAPRRTQSLIGLMRSAARAGSETAAGELRATILEIWKGKPEDLDRLLASDVPYLRSR